MFSSFSVSLFSYIGVAVGTYIGVAVGTYVYLLAAMSFGQALTLPSFSALVGKACHLLRQGIHTLSESHTIETPLSMNSLPGDAA